jgi:hypothetical protein
MLFPFSQLVLARKQPAFSRMHDAVCGNEYAARTKLIAGCKKLFVLIRKPIAVSKKLFAVSRKLIALCRKHPAFCSRTV